MITKQIAKITFLLISSLLYSRSVFGMRHNRVVRRPSFSLDDQAFRPMPSQYGSLSVNEDVIEVGSTVTYRQPRGQVARSLARILQNPKTRTNVRTCERCCDWPSCCGVCCFFILVGGIATIDLFFAIKLGGVFYDKLHIPTEGALALSTFICAVPACCCLMLLSCIICALRDRKFSFEQLIASLSAQVRYAPVSQGGMEMSQGASAVYEEI